MNCARARMLDSPSASHKKRLKVEDIEKILLK